MTEPPRRAEPPGPGAAEPPRPGLAGPQEPAPPPEIVQWGTERTGRLRLRLRGYGKWRDPRIAWVVAGLGGLALFSSMLDGWQVTRIPVEFPDGELQEITAELPAIGVWGTAWLVAITALATGMVLAVGGPPALRSAARSIGLAIAGVTAALLAALTISLGRSSVLDNLFGLQVPGRVELEPEIGRGVYTAYLGLVLVAAALWWARPEAGPAGAGVGASPAGRRGPEPSDPAYQGPGDLTVRPVEPFTQLGEGQGWR